jgi:hypothetical protein
VLLIEDAAGLEYFYYELIAIGQRLWGACKLCQVRNRGVQVGARLRFKACAQGKVRVDVLSI